VNLQKLEANFGYTLDGEERGSLEDETWNADSAKVVFEGVSAHPGYAKGKLVNALKVAGTFLQQLPQKESPEETEGRVGFVHPVQIQGIAEKATVDLILRNFTLEGLDNQRKIVGEAAKAAEVEWPGSKVSYQFSEQYRNMKSVLDLHPEVTERALKAMAKVGLTPIRKSIRGGTDGARFTLMGLPCPNLFAGEHAFHSKKEWVSLEDMELAVQVALEIVQVPAERSL
jgi:tripeptide aminopeptidase